MRGRVINVNSDVFVVKLGDDVYSIIELPPITNIRDIYTDPDVEFLDEIQGELMTEGSVEIRNLTKGKTLNLVIRKSPATKYDVFSAISNP